MNRLLLGGIFSIAILISSCGKEDTCTSPGVIGTYSGTVECDEMSAETASFEVTSGTSDYQIIINGINTVIDDCDIFGSNVFQGTGSEIDGDIDGNEIHFIETIILNGDVDFRCLWKGVKN